MRVIPDTPYQKTELEIYLETRHEELSQVPLSPEYHFLFQRELKEVRKQIDNSENGSTPHSIATRLEIEKLSLNWQRTAFEHNWD